MRSYIEISGDDATAFLQGLITQDVAGMNEGETRFSAMLSAQGKWQHDFFITPTDSGFFIDIRSDHAEVFVKKLSLYKLRSKVSIQLHPEMRCYFLPASNNIGNTDVRDVRMPRRLWQTENLAAPEGALSEDDYHAQRIALCIPEGGIDVTDQETALDVSYDLLHAVSFTKGCYIGQEVTARMHYKAITRKGFFALTLSAPLHQNALPLKLSDGKTDIAEIRSAAGTHAIAYGRFDSCAPYIQSQQALAITDTVMANISIPDWQANKYQRFMESSV